MHYNVHYDGLVGQAKIDAAMEDIRNYLAERFDIIEGHLKEQLKHNQSLEQFTVMLSFAGIQGYPVRAWYELLVPEDRRRD